MGWYEQAEIEAEAAAFAPQAPAQFAVVVLMHGENYANEHSDLTDAKLDAQSQHAHGATAVTIVSLKDIRRWRVSPKTGKVLLVRDYADASANVRL